MDFDGEKYPACFSIQIRCVWLWKRKLSPPTTAHRVFEAVMKGGSENGTKNMRNMQKDTHDAMEKWKGALL